MKYYELISDYLEGGLSAETRKAFEEEMGRDEFLRREVELHRGIDAALSESDVLQLRGKLKSIHRDVTHPAKETRILRLKPRQAVYAVAAVALLLVASAWLFQILNTPSLSTDDLYAMYYQPDDAVMIMRSGSEGQDQGLLMEALKKYEEQDYEGALQLFKKDNSNVMVHFYSGLAYMEIERFNEAINSFQTILDDNENLFVEQAQWYQGLCYLKTGRTDRAREALNSLNLEDNPYRTKAEFILRNLKD